MKEYGTGILNLDQIIKINTKIEILIVETLSAPWNTPVSDSL